MTREALFFISQRVVQQRSGVTGRR